MAAPIRFLSGRNQQQKIGIEGSTDNQKVLEVVGRVGIGTTIFEPDSELEVRGDAIVSGIITAGSIDVSSGEVNFDNVNVSGVNVQMVVSMAKVEDLIVIVGGGTASPQSTTFTSVSDDSLSLTWN